MIKELLLKNTPEMAIVDPEVYNYFINDDDFKKIKFVENLRVHSHGYPFYQKSLKKQDGKYVVKTIYLHKIIAEKLRLTFQE